MNADPHTLLLELDAWDAATSEDRLSAALVIAESLPKTFRLKGLVTCALGNQSREIATFVFDDCSFALLPGKSNAVLGYDRSHPYQPSLAQLNDWQIVRDEYDCTIDEYLNECLGPLRSTMIQPLLVETVARRFKYAQSGDNQAEGYNRVQSLFDAGFRLPTPDEWEYICAAGSRTLFRWGNECPVCNSYDDREFLLHTQPNAFGVTLNSSTYDSEICRGPMLRGGDGGGSVCGGIGNVITWFPFASSFQVTEEEIAGWWIDDVFARRVLPVALAKAA